MIRLLERAGDRGVDPLLIGHLLRTPLATAPDQEIVYRDLRRYSYRQLHERIARLAGALAALGIGEGDTVAVMDWDSHRYLECYFAIPMMGAVLQTVNVRLSAAQIAYTLQHAGAQVLLVHRDFLGLLAGIRDGLSGIREVVILEDAGAVTLAAAAQDTSGMAMRIAGEYEALLAAQWPAFSFKEFDENAVATTFYTTGTTGPPKAVCFSHRQLVLHTLAVLAALASPEDGQCLRLGDVYMPLTPMFHVHAWGIPYVATLLGIKQVYPGRYDPVMLLRLRTRERVSYSHCVPTVLQMLLDAAKSAGTDLRGWKINVGGAALPLALARRAMERGVDIFAAYGMSETCPYLTVTRLSPRCAGKPEMEEVSLTQRCRTGLPLPLVDLRLVSPAGTDLPHDGLSLGEIVVRAPWLTAGYVDDAVGSAELWEGGYLHTRDLATIDQAGYVQIRDRLKDLIKSGGEWISSLQLEDLIARHPQVCEVAVVAAPDLRWGERPVPIIVPRGASGSILSLADIREHLQPFVVRGELPKYAVPDRIVLVAALSRTSVGKVDKKSLRERLVREWARDERIAQVRE